MSRGRRVAGYCLSAKRKPGYRTLRRARDARDRALALQLRGDAPRKPLWTYRCPLCGWWHLTSQPPHHRPDTQHPEPERRTA